jgi:hypothetical protein
MVAETVEHGCHIERILAAPFTEPVIEINAHGRQLAIGRAKSTRLRER